MPHGKCLVTTQGLTGRETKLDQVVNETVETRAAHFVVGEVGEDGVLWHGSAAEATSQRAADRDTVFGPGSPTNAIAP
jgi:hypothetical protein